MLSSFMAVNKIALKFLCMNFLVRWGPMDVLLLQIICPDVDGDAGGQDESKLAGEHKDLV